MNLKFENGSIEYLQTDDPDFLYGEADFVSVSVPAGTLQYELKTRGFRFVDRTLFVSVPTKRPKVNFEKMIRLPVEHSDTVPDACFRIAKAGFVHDARFHINDDEALADCILRSWLHECKGLLICSVKGETGGFIDLEESENMSLFVRLAATDERFRRAGTALSLYSRAAIIAQDRGCSSLDGRFSTRNTDVMNLYACLGGHFSDPRDVFIKDVGNERR